MKKLFLFISFLFSLVVQAQYYPMLKENKYWDEEYYSSPPSICNVDGGRRYFVYGDTIINSVTYKKIFGHTMGSYVGSPFCPPFYFNNDGLFYLPAAILREDTIQRKVFIWDDNTEYVLWDFSLNAGDTIYAGYHYPFDIVVDSVGMYPLHNGDPRKAIFIDGCCVPFYVEEAGGFNTMFQKLNGPYSLICVKDNNEVIWGNGSCYNFLSLNENEKQRLNFYVDENGYLIFSGNEKIDQIAIFNVHGSKIFSSGINNVNASVGLQEIPSGLYILQVFLNNESFRLFKILL